MTKKYQTVGYGTAAYAETSGYDVLRLDKPVEVIGPKAIVVTTLTPTLRWKPVPGAVRYEVGVDDFTPPEDPLTTRRSYRTDTPNFELTEPLERDRFYGWSVTAYTEDGTRIASNYAPMFSTARRKTLRPVNVRGIGVSTVLPNDWQWTSPGVFENVNAQGEEVTLTFEKQPIVDLEASLKADAKTLLGPLSQRHAGRDWTFITQEDNSIRLVTLQDNFAYFITTSGIKFEKPTPLAMEFFATVLPPMLQNF